MTREIRSQHTIKGFTPLFDKLIESHDLMTAAVYGRVWRFSQMKDGVCYAAVQRIADEVGVSYDTALRRLKLLCDEGYLVDENPGLRNGPHRYRTTGKLDLEHVSETRASETPSSGREQDEPSSGREQDPSSGSLRTPSSGREQDEDTFKRDQHTSTADCLAGFSELQRQAYEELKNIGFQPRSDRLEYAEEQPELVLAWIKHMKTVDNVEKPAAFLRYQLREGAKPPEPEPSAWDGFDFGEEP